MARVVLGMGTSQSPLLSIDPSDWSDLAKADIPRKLVRKDGVTVTYDQALAEAGDKYARIADDFPRLSKAAQAALDRLAADLAAAAPDLIVLIADDQRELFTTATLPALAVYRGPVIANHLPPPAEGAPAWRHGLREGNLVEAGRNYPGATEFADDLIGRLVERHIDVGVADTPVDPQESGIGHAWAFVINRLLGGREIPVVPVLLNTWYPPNVPTPARSFDIGEALRVAIEENPADIRVAIIASGGLSHYIVNEELDRTALAAIEVRDRDTLAKIPRQWLLSGSGQVLDWILLSGALSGFRHQWTEYLPAYRTVAGSGVGLAFAVWTPPTGA